MHQRRLMIWLLIILSVKSLRGSEIISTNKPAYQISTGTHESIARVAELAVDGNTDPDYLGGDSCSSTISTSSPNPWWYVDLQNTYSVSSVSIYTSTSESFKRRVADIELRVGYDTAPPFSGNTKCGSTITEAMVLNDNPVTMTCSQPISGQYVTLYRTAVHTDTNVLTLCEVEVYTDTEAPVVTCPDDVSVGTDPGKSTATVTWNAPTVTDDVYTNLLVTCAIDSSPIDTHGSSFAIGEMTVDCQSTDYAGKTGSCSFSVVISDTEAPVVTCPGEVSVGTDPGQSTATVTWSDLTVTDNVDIDLPVTCTTGSSPIDTHGSSFVIGEMTVDCQSTDNADNTGSCSFSVVISDNEDPTVTCPVDVSVVTDPGQSTATAIWDNPVVSDNVDDDLSATCFIGSNSTASGLSFAIGKTKVSCNSTDKAGNTGSCTFSVEVEVEGTMDSQSGSSAVTVSVIVAVFSVVLLVVFFVLIWKKRMAKNNVRRPKDVAFSVQKPLRSGTGKEQNEGQVQEDGDYQNAAFSVENEHSRRPSISIQNLPDIVRVKKASGEIADEWRLFPEGIENKDKACVALNSHNTKKNRYRNVVPYDTHRVVLEKINNDPYSDYINACFMKGHKHEKSYIAAQGPNTASIVDFWRMIWQENVRSIVMATHLVENGKNKCSKYWPEKAEMYGKISVSKVEEIVYKPAFCVRRFTMMRGSDMKNVNQYHFLVWPDKDVPRSPSPVISMLKVIEKETPSNAGPIVVHCSAGAGRTGAIITIDAMVKNATQTGQINVFEFVMEMRRRRPEMVQTALQYEFVYDTILNYIYFGETSCTVLDFKESFQNLQKINPESNKTYLSEEFEALRYISSVTNVANSKGGMEPHNIDKNRFPDKVPIDRNRPIIMTPGVAGASDYINASFLDGVDKKDMFIGTQAPMQNTVEDFWRMVVDYKAQAIVILNDFRNRDQTFAEFWPIMEDLKFTSSHLTVSLVNSGVSAIQVNVHTVDVVSKKKKTKSLNVRIFEYLGWPADSYTPSSSKKFLGLVNAVIKWKTEVGDAPVVVMCMDGLGRTGMFCATLSTLKKIPVEQVVDVVQEVSSLRRNRPGMVQNLAQYEFIYQTVLEYMSEFHVYGNVARDEEETLYANI